MISLHVIIDGLDNAALDRCYNWIVKNRPSFTNIKGAEQFDRAQQFAERVRSALPDKTIIIRKWPDDGAFKRFDWNGFNWYQATVVPLRDWLKRYDFVLLADNESAEDNMHDYAVASVQAMRRATEDGIGLALGRSATGNWREDQYAQLDPLWEEFPRAPKCLYSPNEYHAQTPELSGGHIGRYQLAWKRCNELKIPHPVTTIGEYGYLHSANGQLDPEYGWRRAGLTGAQAAAMDILYHRVWYAQYHITPCVFDFGTLEGRWKDTSVDDEDYLKAITEYNATLNVTPPPIVIPPQQYPPLPPLTDAAWSDALASSKGVNIRSQPAVIEQPTSNVVKVFTGENQRVKRTPALYGAAPNGWGGLSWQASDGKVYTGWVHNAHVEFKPYVPPIVEPPEPQPLGNYVLEFRLENVTAEFASTLAKALTIHIRQVGGLPAVIEAKQEKLAS